MSLNLVIGLNNKMQSRELLKVKFSIFFINFFYDNLDLSAKMFFLNP